MPFEIFKARSGKFYFRLKAGNGKVILQSLSYTSMAAASNGVQSVIKHAADDDNFKRKVAVDGSPYFSLKASNGQDIGRSVLYGAVASRENGIKSVQKHAIRDAVIKDLT